MTPDSPRTKDDHRDIVTIAEQIEEAWRSGRTIVPIIGAGLSADSGFPVLRSVVRYLAKFHALLQLTDVPIRSTPAAQGLLDKIKERYHKRPRYFVTDFNWPDRFQLNQDLLALWPESETVSSLVAKQLTELAPTLNPAAFWPYDALKRDVVRVTQAAHAGIEKAINDPLFRSAVARDAAAAQGEAPAWLKNLEQALGDARKAAEA
ncbi:hypothetical protein [Frigoriglobus tundricola]|uniref:Uncharacterized protein n=1 Tax=Frigoriglobus tundricola TaxID=2774151 RepID=A0A6M5YYH8_9BACT|nr:hypothetical protein [Frigoriglobus tundricola]QJW99069.1 hypothetical protein FTUN_6667 [Frigoriglobus tundricola]